MNDVKKLLDDISPTFCLAKWLYVQIHLPHGLTQSCYHPPAHKIPLEELDQDPGALHNTKFKIAERKQMVLRELRHMTHVVTYDDADANMFDRELSSLI